MTGNSLSCGKSSAGKRVCLWCEKLWFEKQGGVGYCERVRGLDWG